MKLYIVTASYNSAPFLSDYFSSLFYQTDKDFNVVFVDHGSTDNTFQIVNKWKRILHDKVTVFKIEKNNGGPVVPYNLGFNYAFEQGADWIWRLDSDDYLDQNAIEIMKQEIPKANEKTCAIAVNARRFGAEWGLQLNIPDLTWQDEVEENRINAFACYNAKIWKDLGGYSPKLRYEDWTYWIEALRAGYNYIVLEKLIFNYRRHNRSLTHIWKSDTLDIINSVHRYYGKTDKKL